MEGHQAVLCLMDCDVPQAVGKCGNPAIAPWCQHVEKVSGPENTSKHPNLSEVCFLALFLWL